MPLQNFVANSLPTIKAAWLNAVDAMYFTLFNAATTAAQARTAINIDTFATTATAAGTTTLVLASAQIQEFTGTTTQTIVLPVATTLTAGHHYDIINNSTGALTINSSGANLVQTLNAGERATITCILASGTSAASWGVAVQLKISNVGALNTAALTASGLITANNGLNVNGTVTIDNSANTTLSVLTGRNTSAGNAASSQIALGNNTSATLLTINSYASTVAAKTNYVEILNTANSHLTLGTNNTVMIDLSGTSVSLGSNSLTTNGGVQTFGANDSAGAGYRLVKVPNI